MENTQFETLEKIVYNNDLEALKNERGGSASMLVQKFGRTSMIKLFS